MAPPGVIPLARNESYWMLDEFEAQEWLPSGRHLSTYPQYDRLQEQIADANGISKESVVVTAGSDAAIAALAAWCRREGREAILPIPTFYGYERILAAHGVSVTFVRTTPSVSGLAIRSAPIIERMAAQPAAVVFLCQPNNPLGSLIAPDEFELILSAAKRYGSLVVVDEAYAEFANPTCIARVHESLIVLRTFSKSFGLAGVRVGYAVVEPRIRTQVTATLLPWPIAHQSVDIALWALARAHEFGRLREQIIEAREAFAHDLALIPHCTPVPSRTNFIFAWVGDGSAVATALQTRGVAVAPGASLSFDPEMSAALAGGIRMSVPSPAHRPIVISMLTQVLDVLSVR